MVVLEVERAAVASGDRCGEAQPQPGTRPGARRLDPEEALEDPRLERVGDSRAAVADDDLDPPAVRRRPAGQRYLAAFGGEPDGVVDQVGDALEHQVAVALDAGRPARGAGSATPLASATGA